MSSEMSKKMGQKGPLCLLQMNTFDPNLMFGTAEPNLMISI